jgi:protein-S-isoprenylcysteine O-methyltransferase Ste14
MEAVRRAELRFWTFVSTIIALTTATILFDRGYLWPLIDLGDAIFYAGLALMAVGWSIRRIAIMTLGRYFSNVLVIKEGQSVVRTGMYASVRHPAYTGTLVMVAGIPLVFSSPIGLIPVSLSIPAVLFRISVEERMLTERFGDEYRDYMKRTKKLLPGIY